MISRITGQRSHSQASRMYGIGFWLPGRNPFCIAKCSSRMAVIPPKINEKSSFRCCSGTSNLA